MPQQDQADLNTGRTESLFSSSPGLILLGFLFIAGALLFTEHRAHAVLGAFIWVLFIAGLLLPAFMPGGWRGTSRRPSSGGSKTDRDERKA